MERNAPEMARRKSVTEEFSAEVSSPLYKISESHAIINVPMDALKALFTSYFGYEPLSVELLPQSGSNRKYYRMCGKSCAVNGAAVEVAGNGGAVICIGVIGTDDRENRTFCELSDCLDSVGVSVPRVIAHSVGYERYLQEDLGCTDLNSILKNDRETGVFPPEHRELLMSVVRSLPKIQFAGGRVWDFSKCYPSRCMNARKIMFDLNYFKYCFLKPMGVEFNEELLQDEFEKLCADILSDPSENIFLYRDFQSRNVMVKDGKPYFIDFQSGMRGPFYYDLASFVFQFADRYPAGLREELVSGYYSALLDYFTIDYGTFRKRLNLYVLLRHLQVLGCYGFRGLIEGKQIFIDCIPDGFKGIKEILSSGIEGYDYICECLRMLYDKGIAKFRIGASV